MTIKGRRRGEGEGKEVVDGRVKPGHDGTF